VDVAFHVDMTQERKGYASEVELNAIRAEYIERARGLPLSVFFNTTAYDGNFHEIPAVAAFFVANADVVRVASFQLQADTGRGTVRARRQPIDIDTVAAQLRAARGRPINFDTPIAGHSECNRYAMTLVRTAASTTSTATATRWRRSWRPPAGIQFDRQHRGRAVMALARGLARRPGRHACGMFPGLSAGSVDAGAKTSGRARTGPSLSLFIHNSGCRSTSACERIEACVLHGGDAGRTDLECACTTQARQLHPAAGRPEVAATGTR
jgi:hypothetical protein